MLSTNYPSKEDAIKFVKYYLLTEDIEYISYSCAKFDNMNCMELCLIGKDIEDIFCDTEYRMKFIFFDYGECWYTRNDLRFILDICEDWEHFKTKYLDNKMEDSLQK